MSYTMLIQNVPLCVNFSIIPTLLYSGKWYLNSTNVPIHAANISSPFAFPPFSSRIQYHSGASGLSGGARRGRSVRLKVTIPTKSSLITSLSLTKTSRTED
ncbi:hypothetical protein IEQ34_014594 [Dendrobium chrysotoxum]|uniref:Uncharacterized protein n=1 Tax=Dendrobium chrysotoxum TaxID=161865 RepID=A0AAV7GKB7_DENCH|nr:hypothetical protein IEQ34_014594 [Dendrobium chrysotoxum]